MKDWAMEIEMKMKFQVAYSRGGNVVANRATCVERAWKQKAWMTLCREERIS